MRRKVSLTRACHEAPGGFDQHPASVLLPGKGEAGAPHHVPGRPLARH
jgi:hypothetical protein